MHLVLSVLFLFAISFPAHSGASVQSSEPIVPVLFSIGDTEVKLDEFSRVFNRNNPTKNIHTDREEVEEYLELYINFRLKVKEAETLGLDTVTEINRELEGYRKQLAQSFIFDKDVTENLIQEAYSRMIEEVHVSHILLTLPENALPADTLETFRRIMNIRRRAVRGEDFENLAREHSQDPSVEQNGGDIGYLTAFRTVYPFENAAYKTASGEISMPVRTRFGYHIIKVHGKRPARGEMVAAHILITVPADADENVVAEAESKINHIYSLLQEESDFSRLAMRHSDDQFSARRGGDLPPFGTGRMVPEFENAAFSLQEDGEYSEPIRTQFGYHIVKRKQLQPPPKLEDIRNELRGRVERDTRSDIARKHLIEKIKRENNFREWQRNYDELAKLADNNILTGTWSVENPDNFDKPLFRIGDREYKQNDFIHHILDQRVRRRTGNAQDIFRQMYVHFQEEEIIAYEEYLLEERNPEFKALMQEYRNGILLFELTDQKVWSKALQDTTGLVAFHEQNKERFMWEERVKAKIFTLKEGRDARKVRRWANRGRLSDEDMLSRVNDAQNPSKLVIEEKLVEKGQNALIDAYDWETGISPDVSKPDGSISFVQYLEIRKPEPKKLNEARGFIISAYQEQLERNWVRELRQTYPVTVNKSVLESLWN